MLKYSRTLCIYLYIILKKNYGIIFIVLLQNVKKPTVKPKSINKMLLAASAKAKKPKVKALL